MRSPGLIVGLSYSRLGEAFQGFSQGLSYYQVATLLRFSSPMLFHKYGTVVNKKRSSFTIRNFMFKYRGPGTENGEGKLPSWGDLPSMFALRCPMSC